MGLIFCLIISCVILSSCVCLVPIQTNNTEKRFPCTHFESIEFAKIKVMNIPNIHQAIHIECEHGYTLKGKHKLLCSNGLWDQVPWPQCVPNMCRNPRNISNGDITIEGEKEGGLYKKGTLVTYICDNGYRLVPSESKYRVCEKGIWTGVMGKCELISCKPPRDIENGYYVPEKKTMGEEFNIGQRVYYSCNSGYILNGPTVQHCIDGGTWSPRIPHPICDLKISDNNEYNNCPKIPQLEHVQQQFVPGNDLYGYTPGTEIALRCANGYMNTASASCEPVTLRCAAGVWIGDLPNCVLAKECYIPPNVPNAVLLGRDITYRIGSQITYECIEGYVLRGSRHLTCTINGCWEGIRPSCQTDTQLLDEYMTQGGTLLVSMATAAGVMLMLLGVCMVVMCRHRKPWSRQPLAQTVGAAVPHGAVSTGDSTSALINDPDRLALIAFADGMQNSGLPSYEEAIRERATGPGNSGLLGYRPHRPHWPALGARRGRGPGGTPGDTHVTRQSSCTSHSASMRSGSAGDPMGSTDTMTPSEVSTNITLDTVSSHSGSQPASCRAICGSLASFDTSSVLNTEGVPLLEENEMEETPSAETGSIGVADNASYKYHGTSPDLA